MDQSEKKTAVSPDKTGNLDTPRTSNLKFLRAKRLDYFCGKNAKSSLSDLEETPVPIIHKSTVHHQAKRSKSPRKCRSAPLSKEEQPTLTCGDVHRINSSGRCFENTTDATDLSPATQETSSGEQSTHRSVLRTSFISDLDQDLLEDISVPEAQKLQHVMTWAKKFLNKCNGTENLQNSLSHKDYISNKDETAANGKNKATSALDPSSFNTFLSTNTIFSNAPDNEDMKDSIHKTITAHSSLDFSVLWDESGNCDKHRIKSQPYVHDSEEEIFMQNYCESENPRNIYDSKFSFNQIPNSAVESDNFLTHWTSRNNKEVVGTTSLANTHCSHEEKKYFTESSFPVFPVPSLNNPNTFRKISTNDLTKQLADHEVQNCYEEKDITGNTGECRNWNYGLDSCRMNKSEVYLNNYEEQDITRSPVSTIDTERLDALLLDFGIIKESSEEGVQPSEIDGSRTDRTFIVKRFVDDDDDAATARKSKLNGVGISDNINAHSVKYFTEDPTISSCKVCLICESKNNSITNWCAECGSTLMAAQNQSNGKGAPQEKKIDEIFIPEGPTKPDNHQRSIDEIPISKLNNKEYKATVCWEECSNVDSDCSGSVLEKYLFYVNQLDMRRNQEKKKMFLPHGHSNELSSEDDSTDEHGKPVDGRIADHSVIETDVISDSEDEIQFLDVTNNIEKQKLTFTQPPSTINDKNFLDDHLKGFRGLHNGTKVKDKLDRKLQKDIHISSKMTVPKRYWEKSSIAWSSYTHGELKPRSNVIQRPSSAEARKRIPKNQFPGDKYTGAVTEHLSRRKWDGFSETLKWNSEGERGSLWLLLPDELWIIIFSKLSHKDLSKAAQVCQRFRHIANDDSLWKVIQITNCHSLTDDCLITIGLHHPESLTLYRCHDNTKSITEEGLGRLFENCRDSLKELKITNVSGPKFEGDAILFSASNYCNQLTSVDISWTAATDKGIIALVASSSCLQNISVNGCKITDQAITALVKKHWRSLIKLEVFGCHDLSASCLSTVVTECVHLQNLNIGRLPKVTDVCLSKIASSLHQITTLNMTGLNAVRDRVVHHIVKQCPKLENLTLSSCCQVTDVSLVEISTYLRTIKYLDVSGCKKVSDIGIQALARSCQQIRYLDLSSTGTGKRGVCLLASYCYSSLECLKLSFCKDVTADAIGKLCKNCKRLKMLHLYGCRIAPDTEPIKKFSKKFKIFHDLSIPTANILGE